MPIDWLIQNGKMPYTGTLAPGTYSFTTTGGGNDDVAAHGYVQFGAAFDVAEVPEPAALLSMAVGTLLLLPRKR
jgi:hypothetical protein